jgi:hypothetical protein
MKNLIAPLDRAHQILLATRIKALEHVSERLAAEITRFAANFTYVFC